MTRVDLSEAALCYREIDIEERKRYLEKKATSINKLVLFRGRKKCRIPVKSCRISLLNNSFLSRLCDPSSLQRIAAKSIAVCPCALRQLTFSDA